MLRFHFCVDLVILSFIATKLVRFAVTFHTHGGSVVKRSSGGLKYREVPKRVRRVHLRAHGPRIAFAGGNQGLQGASITSLLSGVHVAHWQLAKNPGEPLRDAWSSKEPQCCHNFPKC